MRSSVTRNGALRHRHATHDFAPLGGCSSESCEDKDAGAKPLPSFKSSASSCWFPKAAFEKEYSVSKHAVQRATQHPSGAKSLRDVGAFAHSAWLWVSRSLLEAVAHGGNPQDRAASLYVARAVQQRRTGKPSTSIVRRM